MEIYISGKKQSGKDTLGLMLGYILNYKINPKECNYVANWNNFKNILELKETEGISKKGLQLLFRNMTFDSFAKPLKEMAAGLLQCDINDFESESFKNKHSRIWNQVNSKEGFYMTNREVLIWLGDIIRKDNPYYFAHSLLKRNNLSNRVNRDSDINLIVTDLRLKNEMNVVNGDNSIFIRLTKCKENNINHDTENDLDSKNVKWDFLINNENMTLEELYNRAEIIINDIW